ncbi:MAG: hypothetical protein IPM34_07965 [Saprospiraceae bacterium]|nr:hypothetical protein [Saprospiraceae bacterium]
MQLNSFLYLVIFLTAGQINLYSQVIQARLLDNVDQKPVGNAKVTELVSGAKLISDQEGYLQLDQTKLGLNIRLEIIADQYKPYYLQLSVADWGQNLQEIYLQPVPHAVEARLDIIQNEETDDESSGDVYSLLSSSENALLRVAGFEWSAFRFKLKGLPNSYDQLGFNGFLLNDLEYGRLPFHLFSGLTLVSKYSEDYVGYKENLFDFGSAGVGQWITSNPAAYRKEFAVNYGETNRSYDRRIGVHFASGIRSKGFSWIAGGTRRWAQEGFIPGSFYDAWGAYLGFTKSFNAKNQLSFMALYAPVIRGKSSPGTQEVYDLSGDHFYNSYWGYQNGEKRNSREVKTNSPVAFLNFRSNISEFLSFQTGIMAVRSQRYDSQLDWHNAPDPRPDYYQKLPSSIEDSSVAAMVTSQWKSDVNIRQINWDRLYQANYNNIQSIQGADGIQNHVVNGKRAVYWISKRFSNFTEFEHFGNLNWIRKRHELNLKYRIEFSNLQQYLEASDLLGADFLVDVEDFIDDPAKQHPDVLQTQKIVTENEKYGYNYEVASRQTSATAGYVYYGRKFDLNLAAHIKNASFQREGFWQNAIFSNSLGKSDWNSSFGWSARLSGTWKIDGRNYVQMNGAYQKLPNRFDQIFINPEWRSDAFHIKDQTEIRSSDLTYHHRSPGLKIQLGAYFVQLQNQIINKNFFLDDQLESAANAELADGSLINAFYTNYDQNHLGIEASLEMKLGAGFKVLAATSLGDHYISSRPTLHINDKLSTATATHVIYIKNYKVHGSAESAASLGVFYDLPKSGFVTLTANFLDRQFLELNPLRRIAEAVDEVDRNSQQFADILAQEKLPSAFYLNLFLYKPFKLFGESFTASMSVQNLLDNKNLKSGGFEQFRFDYETKNPNAFPSKYYYLQGINYFISLTWKI